MFRIFHPSEVTKKMLYYVQDIIEGGIIGIRRISENSETLFTMLSSEHKVLAEEYLPKLRSRRRVSEWLATRVLLDELLGEKKVIVNQPDGKPLLRDDSFKISISHTHDYVAIILHDKYTVGIDIETISGRIEMVAEKFISCNEYIDNSQKIIHQLLHWSAKETLFKIIDEDEIDFKKHLYIEPFIPLEEGLFKAQELKTEARKFYNINYKIFPEIVLTWSMDVV